MSTPTAHVAHLVDSFVHGLLEPMEGHEVEQHCRTCADCGRALDRARRRLGLLQGVPPAEPSAELVQDTLDRIDAHQQRTYRLRRRFAFVTIGALAASVLLLAGLHLYYANLTASSYDIVVLGQQQLLASTTASLRVRVVDRNTGRAAVPGVPVKLALLANDGREQQLAEFKTNEQGGGNPRFELPDWQDGTYQLRIVATPRSGAETLTRPIQLKRSWKVMLSSDKPVYQPGQTIQLRALALRRPDLKPIGKQTAIFTLVDPKGNILFKHTQPTSKFGITSASCELAQEIQEGAYTVVCKVGDTESKLSVEIRLYVLPKFKLDVRPNRTFYQPGNVAKVTIQADYFFGKPVGAGDIEMRVRARDVGDRVIGTVKGKTNDKGTVELKYTLPMELPGMPQHRGDARIGFEVTLTDSAGQKQSALAQRLVTTRPYRIEAIPEAGALVRGVANVVYLLVSMADGSPINGARVTIDGTDVKAETATDARGAAQFSITPQDNQVSWTIRVSDRTGEPLTRRVDTLMCGQAGNDFLVRPDRAVYQAGQTMTLTALGAGVEPVFIDFIKDGQTLLSDTVELIDGKGEHTLDLPAELFGTIELVAYRFGPTGLPVRKSRVVYVTPAKGLKIHATLDRPEYRPGRSANLKLALTDDNGRPVPGAVSLAAVDEAVFAVMAQRPGMEQTFYTLEEELLKPVYAIYPWMPGDEQASRRDRGLFATTAKSVQGGAVGDNVMAPAGRHTLAVSSFPEKVQKLEQLRLQRLNLVRRGWIGLVLGALLLGYVSLWVYLPAYQVLMIHGIGLIVVMALGTAALVIMVLGTGAKSTFMPTDTAAPAGRMAEGMRDRGMDFAKQLASRPRQGVRKNDWPGDAGNAPPTAAGPPKKADQPAAPRVRNYFPETLLWKPELITDDQGRLPPVPIHLADSITTWRLSASALSADGRLGATQMPMKVFQPFFVDLDLPVSMTRGDEVGVPVVVYNYLDRPQTVKLTLAEGKWFKLSGSAEREIELGPGEVRSTRFTLTVEKVGTHRLRVTALAGKVGDAIERDIEVMPDGRKVEMVHSGSLDRPVTHTLEVPANTIEGSVRAFVKLYPSSFSQVVEGLENIFRMPYGCFEQTSSTTYPNILALSYLRETKQKSPQVEARARQYIHLGYQRLVGFEVPGGGFEWFGKPPAHRTLTAYGLMEFEDMAKVHDVDPNLITRTRRWLLSQRQADGAWEPDNRVLHEDPTGKDAKQARLGATAYIAWAVFGSNQAGQEGRTTLDFLIAHPAREITNNHVLALVCHALLSLEPTGKDAAAYVEELARRATRLADGKHACWEPPGTVRTLFHGGGNSAKVETTALAALALLCSSTHQAQARPALAWLITQKDAQGTWHSTQATVLSLKALLAGTGKILGEGGRQVVVEIGQHRQEVDMPADQAEVMKLLDLSRHLKPGKNELSLVERTRTGPGYQVVLRYHVPEAKDEGKKEPLTIQIDYDRTDLAVDEVVRATATVTNRMDVVAPMVMLDLPVPPGFAADTNSFNSLVQAGTIARFQARPRSVLVYLRGLKPGQSLKLTYTLKATMPVKATAGVARVYEYYDPRKEGTSPARRFTVRARD
jgi:hypothetical protein